MTSAIWNIYKMYCGIDFYQLLLRQLSFVTNIPFCSYIGTSYIRITNIIFKFVLGELKKDLEESNSSEEGEELWLAEKSETEEKENAWKASVSRASQHKKYDLDTFEDDLDHDASEDSKELGRFNDKMLHRLMIGAIAASSATIGLTVLIFLLYKWR